MFFINEGLVFAVDFTESGEKKIGLVVDRNTLLGETSLLLGTPTRMGFQAQIKTRAHYIPEEEFNAAFESDKEVSQYVARLISAKMFMIRGLYNDIKTKSVMWRICNTLFQFSQRYGKSHGEGSLIAFPLSQQLIADFVNANRVTVTKCMQSLKKSMVITKINDYYDIPDVASLIQYRDTQVEAQ